MSQNNPSDGIQSKRIDSRHRQITLLVLVGIVVAVIYFATPSGTFRNVTDAEYHRASRRLVVRAEGQPVLHFYSMPVQVYIDPSTAQYAKLVKVRVKGKKTYKIELHLQDESKIKWFDD